ncbi:MAG: DUF531 domain-containing protein [Methanococcoides sp.]|nr:DUF531 domain-containing protein [Methanococcoides sp.]
MLTLGLINTYDKIKVLDAHYRAIARAAPICYAYGLTLCLFDFPFKMTPEELVEYVMDKTTIGGSGKYLKALHENNRLFIFDLPKKGFQSQFGTAVVTTSMPEEKFTVTPEDIAEGVMRNRSYLLLIGLGRKGLPKKLYSLTDHHLDITCDGISLETCTAMGIIPAYIMGIVNTRKKLENKQIRGY